MVAKNYSLEAHSLSTLKQLLVKPKGSCSLQEAAVAKDGFTCIACNSGCSSWAGLFLFSQSLPQSLSQCCFRQWRCGED